ncbi:MAG TPA: putative glycolipid-binding domain-containing protein [Pyrinomonadaceae bacterium]
MPNEPVMATDRSIIWRRLDTPGHESARLVLFNSIWHLVGTAVFRQDKQPCRLDYLLQIDSQWHTLSGKVAGWVGDETIDVEVTVDSARRWKLNGQESPEVTGCIDLDLNFSPLTNLLPIRRLSLAVGQEANVRAAWLRFPSFKLEPLDQKYRRLGMFEYRYESNDGRVVADLKVDDVGFVTRYGDLWQVEN